MNIKFWNSPFETLFLCYFKITCFNLGLTIDEKGLNSTIVELDATICSMFTLHFEVRKGKSVSQKATTKCNRLPQMPYSKLRKGRNYLQILASRLEKIIQWLDVFQYYEY